MKAYVDTWRYQVMKQTLVYHGAGIDYDPVNAVMGIVKPVLTETDPNITDSDGVAITRTYIGEATFVTIIAGDEITIESCDKDCFAGHGDSEIKTYL